MTQNNEEKARAERSLINALSTDTDTPLVLVLGPGAFSREVGEFSDIEGEGSEERPKVHKSLRLNFLESVNAFLREEAKEEKLCVNLEHSSIVDGYIALQKIEDDDQRLDAGEFHENFWRNQTSFDYPQIHNFLRLRISAVIYIGYDTLLYEAARYLGIDARLFNLLQLYGGGVHINQYDPSSDDNVEVDASDIDTIEAMLQEGKHVLPIINVLGVRTPSPDYHDLFSTIYETISSILEPSGSTSSKQQAANPLKRLITNTMRYPYGRTAASQKMKILIAGADTESWYSHLISIALREMNKKTSISYMDASPTFSRHPNTSSLTELLGKKSGSVLREIHTNNLMSLNFDDFMKANKVRLAKHDNPKKAFISFANEDESHANDIKKVLWRLGYVPYFYPEDYSNSNYWMNRVRPRIKDAGLFIIVCTKIYYSKSHEPGSAIDRELTCFNEVRADNDSVESIVLDYRTSEQIEALGLEESVELHKFTQFDETFSDIFHGVCNENAVDKLQQIVLEIEEI